MLEFYQDIGGTILIYLLNALLIIFSYMCLKAVYDDYKSDKELCECNIHSIEDYEEVERLHNEIQDLKKERESYREWALHTRDNYNNLKYQKKCDEKNYNRVKEANEHLNEKLNEIMDTNSRLRKANTISKDKIERIFKLVNRIPYNGEEPGKSIIEIYFETNNYEHEWKEIK